MSKTRDGIDDELAKWIGEQHVFFVATAPLSKTGHVNCSPKGGDCFRLTGPMQAAYVDYTGSGAETAAHLQENGRIVIMFCAFKGRPDIVRLHGIGEVVKPSHPGYDSFVSLFPPNAGARAVIRVNITRVSTSCGFSVPLMDFVEDRAVLDKWASAKRPEALEEYRSVKNAVSVDGLPAFSD